MGNDKSIRGDTLARETPGGGDIEEGMKAIDVIVRKGLKNQDFCLLVTKNGIVLIHERSREEIYPGAFGYTSVQRREHNHPVLEDIESAARGSGNLVIPYAMLRKVHLRRGFSASTMRREYIMDLDYLDESRKERSMSLVLTPSPAPGGGVFKGPLGRVALSEYVIEVKRTLVEALPVGGVFVADV